MYTAGKHFIYDGECSSKYGLIIADFNEDSVVETAAFSPILNTIKQPTINRFFHNGIVYETPPQHVFSVLSETAISDENRRAILSWLVGKKEYKKLQMHTDEARISVTAAANNCPHCGAKKTGATCVCYECKVPVERYWYNCVFTSVDIIYIRGACHGFRLTANFDSAYAHGHPNSVNGTAAETLERKTIVNGSDIVDDYVYPILKFVGGEDGQNNRISIVNETDDPGRVFELAGVAPGESIIVDNELHLIHSNTGGPKLDKFTTKNWLRLRPGANILKITGSGSYEITCPTYISIGF